jgi:ABC-type glycerol-3-phosphate transport system substrate-binding protein
MKRFIPVVLLFGFFCICGCAAQHQSPVTVKVFGDVNRVFETDSDALGSIPYFQQQHPYIRIETIAEYNEWEILQKTRAMLVDPQQRKMAPDIIEMPGSWIGEFASQGMLLPLDKWFSELPVEDRTDFIPQLLTSYKSDGKLYGVPALVGMQYLYARKDLLAGEKLPQTLNDLIYLSRKLHSSSGLQGFIFPSEGVHLSKFYYTLFKIAQSTCDSQLSRRKAHMLAYETLRVLVTENQSDYEKFSHAVSEGDFRSGRAALSINGNYVWFLLHQSHDVGFPIGPELVTTGQLPGIDYAAAPRDFIWSRGYAINAATQHPEEALQVLKFLTSTEMSYARLRDRFILPARKSAAVYGTPLPAMQPEAVQIFYAQDKGKSPKALEEITESPVKWRESVEAIGTLLREALEKNMSAADFADAMLQLEKGE